MSDASPGLEVPTSVARAYWHEHAFRGYRLFSELIGRTSTSGLLVLALSGRRLDQEECAFIDEMVVSLSFADPRVWPLKISRIVGAYGRFIPAFAAGYISMEGASVGPAPCAAAARLLREVFEGVQGRFEEAEVISRVLHERLGRVHRLPGFGVAFRPTDERVAALSRCVQARGRDRGAYWRLFQAAALVVRKERKLEPNIDGALAAALLDMGFEGEVLGALATSFFMMTFLANAMEGATEPAPMLREMPLDRVCYAGRPARESPRALARRKGL